MNPVTKAIQAELNRVYERTGVYEQIPDDPTGSAAYAVNDGLCHEFADRVIERLDESDLDADPLTTKGMTAGIDSDVLDERFWPGSSPPELHAPHTWIFDGQRHYDSECPEGCSTFLRLPLIRRSLARRVHGKWPLNPPPLSRLVRMIENEQKQLVSD